jgi:hypothetical protein
MASLRNRHGKNQANCHGFFEQPSRKNQEKLSGLARATVTERSGKIVMASSSNRHGKNQAKLSRTYLQKVR